MFFLCVCVYSMWAWRREHLLRTLNEASFFRYVQAHTKRNIFFVCYFVRVEQNKCAFSYEAKCSEQAMCNCENRFAHRRLCRDGNNSPSLIRDLHLCSRITLCCTMCVRCNSLLLLLNNGMWKLLSIIATVIIFILHGFMRKTFEMHWMPQDEE